MSTSRPDARVGTDLGLYRIEAVLGRGGMGVVYRATDTRLDRQVALKILAPDLAEDEAFRQRFLRESRLAASIDDPNIIPVYEAGEVEGVFFLAMRYVEGTDLETRLRAGPLTPAESVHLLAQVASALDAAHERGLVHRDVKPANILIAPGKGSGRPDHAYLTDFGLTKHRGSQTGMTRAGSFLGTLDYIAPEQLEGKPVDGRADQYALACMAFQCLTGSVPFARDSDPAIMMAHLRDAPPSATAQRPDLPSRADAVLARGMAKEPDGRYPTAEAFVNALRQALGVRPTEEGTAPIVGTRRRWLPATMGFLALAIVAIAAVGVAISSQAGSAATLSPAALVGASLVPSVVPNAFPNPTEAGVLSRMPEDLAARCLRGERVPIQDQGGGVTFPVVSLTCTPPDGLGPGADRLEVRLLRRDDSVDSIADRIAQTNGAMAGGDCASAPPATDTWRARGQDLGVIVCYRDALDDSAVIVWTYSSGDFLMTAFRADGDVGALYRWWESNGQFVGQRARFVTP